jgi:hypothetical protein
MPMRVLVPGLVSRLDQGLFLHPTHSSPSRPRPQHHKDRDDHGILED